MTIMGNTTQEVIANIGITREPGYLYYVDSKGNVSRTKKTGPRRSFFKRICQPFNFMKTKIPRILLDCYVSKDIQIVRKDTTKAFVAVPRKLIGKKFKVILIPEDFYKDKEPEENLNE